MTRRFDTLLIANRGEIACRVARTARLMGLRTVAVYADGDERSPHVQACDVAVRLGPAPARDSYLRADLLIAAAHASGAQAIHPGYGFLSENADFAQAVVNAGLVFVGPPATAIRAMGDKAQAKALMAAAGVPLVPGYHEADQALSVLQAAARHMGWPVLIKACSGGGGKGMRVVHTEGEFADALASCQREAQAAFGDARVLVERYLERPRHIEVQVFADEHGHVLHLGERDCSVQRRHQKVLEEAPAPGLDDAQRTAMAEAAVAAARSVGYVGAGTVEFICDAQGRFHFMEMNTRLQVEHPVTEAVTGLDLVAWQLRVAQGEPLPCTQADIRITGHAIEARLCAEQALRQFLPATGTVQHLHLPNCTRFTPGAVRLDMGVQAGSTVGLHYDNLLGKLIVHGPDRSTALALLQRALSELELLGVTHNQAFLRRVACSPRFAAAQLDTHLLAHDEAHWAQPDALPPHWVAAAVALAAGQADAPPPAGTTPWTSPWSAPNAWRAHTPVRRHLRWQPRDECGQALGDQQHWVSERRGNAWRVLDASGTELAQFQWVTSDTQAPCTAHTVRWPNGVTTSWRCVPQPQGPDTLLTLFTEQGQAHGLLCAAAADGATATANANAAGTLTAPMPGRVLRLMTQEGQTVQTGEPLLVLEAMKMEHTLCAPAVTRVATCHVQAGEQVSEGALLLSFTLPPTAQSTP